VHAQDIRRPLELVRTPSVDALTPVADFFARREFTVASRTQVADLQLRADDGPFAAGTGPLVTGSTLALVMGMARRVSYVAELDGPGVPTLRSRLQATAARTAGRAPAGIPQDSLARDKQEAASLFERRTLSWVVCCSAMSVADRCVPGLMAR